MNYHIYLKNLFLQGLIEGLNFSLEPSESSHFIKEILNSARIDNDNQNDFYPFTEDAINTIVGSMTSVYLESW